MILIFCHVDVTLNISHMFRNEKKVVYVILSPLSRRGIQSITALCQLRQAESPPLGGNTRALIPGQSHLSPGPSQADDVVGNQIVTSQVKGGESAVY